MKKLLEWPKDKKIVAIDFDGTITLGDNRKWIGKESYIFDYYEERKIITDWIRKNRSKMYLILWTCRYGKALNNAIDFCNSINIKFDAVNENIVDFKCSNKIMADYYIDDKSVNVEDFT